MADIEGTANPDTLDGGADADTIDGLDASDLLRGNGGDDQINGGGGNDRLSGGVGNDKLVDDYNGSQSNPDNDTMDGGDGDDVLISYQAEHFLDLDIMRGGAGNDNLVTNGAQTGDSVDGGAGIDQYGGDFGGWAPIVLTFSSVGFVVQVNGINTVSVANCERINFLSGTANDFVTGGALDDDIGSLAGADTLMGGGGDDIISMITTVPLSGVNLNGGVGTDTLRLYTPDGQTYLLDIAAKTFKQNNALFGTIAGFEALSVFLRNGDDTVVGGNFVDDITTGEGNDSIVGGGGDDSLDGREGDDIISGGAGNDEIILGEGAGRAIGGDGNDRIHGSFRGIDAENQSVDAGAGNDRISGLGDGSTVVGGAGTDTLQLENNRNRWALEYADGKIQIASFDDTFIVSGVEFFQFDDIKLNATQIGIPVLFPGATAGANFLNGTANADLMQGLNGNDTLNGNAHNDVVLGGNGADSLSGGIGNDTIQGGAGQDTIIGGVGADRMTGGLQGDRFKFNGLNESGQYSFFPIDVITDFVRGGDRIDLSAIDANAAAVGNNAFKFIGTATFTALGQLRSYQSGDTTYVELNATGTTSADMVFKLEGAIVLRAVDFIV